jgi:hypothetical protein
MLRRDLTRKFLSLFLMQPMLPSWTNIPLKANSPDPPSNTPLKANSPDPITKHTRSISDKIHSSHFSTTHYKTTNRSASGQPPQDNSPVPPSPTKKTQVNTFDDPDMLFDEEEYEEEPFDTEPHHIVESKKMNKIDNEEEVHKFVFQKDVAGNVHTFGICDSIFEGCQRNTPRNKCGNCWCTIRDQYLEDCSECLNTSRIIGSTCTP